MKEQIRKLFTGFHTVPNYLTLFRLILVPVFPALFFNGYRMGALAVFIIASLTDFLDGFLARKLNQISDFGKLFDPLADKLMVLTALICQGLARVFPWSAIAVVLGKELFLMIGSAWMLKRKIVVSSNIFGKIATVLFMASLIASFFHGELAGRDVYLLWASVGFGLAAMVFYIVSAIDKLKQE